MNVDKYKMSEDAAFTLFLPFSAPMTIMGNMDLLAMYLDQIEERVREKKSWADPIRFYDDAGSCIMAMPAAGLNGVVKGITSKK